MKNSMNIEIALKNYRCFPDSKPARFIIKDGFISFIGVNNSGKSSLLKFFYEFRPLFNVLQNPTANLINALRDNQQSMGYSSTIQDTSELFCNLNDRDIEIEIKFRDSVVNSDINGVPTPSKIVLIILRSNNYWLAQLSSTQRNLDTRGKSLDFMDKILRINYTPVCDLTPLFEVFEVFHKMLYIGPFRNAINIGTKSDYFDIQVGQSFIQTWKSYKTGNTKKHNEAIYKLTDDIKRIFEFDSLEINSSPDDSELQLFVNGKSYRLSELGSGLTQFILVLANTAIKEPSMILIDEPELNLHPTLQLDFLTSLTSYAKSGVIFATHSIGLARLSSELKYSIRKNAKKEIEVTDLDTLPTLSEFLGELSFSGYQELGFDKILLVEGSTDVKTYQQFLRKLNIDHKILIMPLGGNSLINDKAEAQLLEIKRISPNISAIIDSELDNEKAPLSKDRAAFVEICKKTKINCHVLKYRATENYLTDGAIKKIKGTKYSAIQPYEALSDATVEWAKSENWRIAREMSKEEIEATDIGKFLKSI